MSGRRASRRAFLALGLGLLAGGCTRSRTLGAIGDSVGYLYRGFPDIPVTRQRVEELPYASMLAKIGRSPRSLVILGRYDGPELHWISADMVALVTRHGRLVKTAGLPENLKDTRFDGTDPIATALRPEDLKPRITRSLDLMPGYRFGVPVHAAYTRLGEERIEILGRDYDTVLLAEDNEVPLLDWTHRNLFWLDRRTHFVWKSTQHFMPGLPPVEMAVTKPAR